MATFTRVNLLPIGSAFPTIIDIGDTGNLLLNAAVTKQYTKNDEGIMVPYAIRQDQADPAFQFTPRSSDITSTALAWLRSMVPGAGSAIWSRHKVIDSETVAAATTGTQGFGAIADDPNCVGYVNNRGVLTALTRQPFATFVPATLNSFAIGANGALKFSTDLVGKLVGLTISYPYTAGVSLGAPLANFRAILHAVENDTIEGTKRLIQCTFARATVDLSQAGSLNSGNPGQITITDLSGSCSVDLEYIDVIPSC
jgi:hypothetical protein